MSLPSKDEIKGWLSWYRLTHAWLADRLGVSVHTVDNWLGSRQAIPRHHLLRLAELVRVRMERDETLPARGDETLHMTLRGSLAASVLEAARRMNLSPAEFAERALLRHLGAQDG